MAWEVLYEMVKTHWVEENDVSYACNAAGVYALFQPRQMVDKLLVAQYFHICLLFKRLVRYQAPTPTFEGLCALVRFAA
jgi:hypothetical protein